ADCTGHGIPGAMMSMLGANFLTQIYQFRRGGSAAKVLDQLKITLFNALNTQGESIHDGLDIAIIKVNFQTNTCQIAGSNRPILLIRNNELTEIKTDKISISGNPSDLTDEQFTDLEFSIEPNDKLYLFTDGITDQFGGENMKKLGSKRFYDLVESVSRLPMKEQMQKIESELVLWKQNQPQTDDILVIGLSLYVNL
ncbi:MAG: serine/threonine-protein phosphatase, partial [Bacteroidia bacterium]|nr:serine/threonine-protein phosphatase [Bacteroidia bacterium]